MDLIITFLYIMEIQRNMIIVCMKNWEYIYQFCLSHFVWSSCYYTNMPFHCHHFAQRVFLAQTPCKKRAQKFWLHFCCPFCWEQSFSAVCQSASVLTQPLFKQPPVIKLPLEQGRNFCLALLDRFISSLPGTPKFSLLVKAGVVHPEVIGNDWVIEY